MGKTPKYRIEQRADDVFVVQEQMPSGYVMCMDNQTLGPAIFESLEAARKWIADQSKYPIYHDAVAPEQNGFEGNVIVSNFSS